MKGPQDLKADSLGTLGAPIRQAAPVAAPVPVAPGVVRNASGQLETVIAPPAPVWHPLPVPAQIWDYGQADDWEGLE